VDPSTIAPSREFDPAEPPSTCGENSAEDDAAEPGPALVEIVACDLSAAGDSMKCTVASLESCFDPNPITTVNWPPASVADGSFLTDPIPNTFAWIYVDSALNVVGAREGVNPCAR
jgi:hypothetical protein